MKGTDPHPLVTRLFSLLLRKRDKEMLLGDLIEESALAGSRKWYWQQVRRSIAPVIWANLHRGGWLKTLGAACLGYFAMALCVIAGDMLEARFISPKQQVYSCVSLAAALAAMVLGGYLAGCMRTGAPIALAVISVVMGVVSLVVTADGAPLWYQMALIIIGPAAALAGGRIRAGGREERRR